MRQPIFDGKPSMIYSRGDLKAYRQILAKNHHNLTIGLSPASQKQNYLLTTFYYNVIDLVSTG